MRTFEREAFALKVGDRGTKNSLPRKAFIHQPGGLLDQVGRCGVARPHFCASFFGLTGESKRNLIPEVVLLAGDPREGVLELRSRR